MVTTKKPTPKDAGASSSIVPLTAVSVAIVRTALRYGSLWVGRVVADTGEQIPRHPFGALLSVTGDTLTWRTVSTWIFVIAAIIASSITVAAATDFASWGGTNGLDAKTLFAEFPRPPADRKSPRSTTPSAESL